MNSPRAQSLLHARANSSHVTSLRMRTPATSIRQICVSISICGTKRAIESELEKDSGIVIRGTPAIVFGKEEMPKYNCCMDDVSRLVRH